MTIAEQIQRNSLPSASADGIGRSDPMGATVVEGGVNFSLFCAPPRGLNSCYLTGRTTPVRPA